MWWPLAIVLTGCASIDPIDAPYAHPVCDLWPVPVEGGAIVTCSAARIVVEFPDGQREPIATRWRDALLVQGWAVAENPSAPGAPTFALVRGEERIVLGVVGANGASVATAARAP
jgi:hypothetical protein